MSDSKSKSSVEVYKFGGSSVRDAEAFKRSANLVTQNPQCRIVVVSATYNSTNRLEQVYRFLAESHLSKAKESLSALEDHHRTIEQDLSLPPSALWNQFQKQLTEFSAAQGKEKILDEIYSWGERASSEIFAKLLNQKTQAVLFDAREVILTSDDHQHGSPLRTEIKEAATRSLKPLLSNSVVVTQGFIGKTKQGATTTLGREGSDFSATLFAEAIEASSVTIWTDVAGVASFDPKLMPDFCWLDHLSFMEARILATGGAKVLFPRTLDPVEALKIPVWVRSSYESQARGTLISDVPTEKFAMALKESGDKAELSLVGSSNQVEKVLSEFGELFFASQRKSWGAMIELPKSLSLETTQKIHAALLKTVSK